MSIYLSNFCLQLWCQGFQVKFPMGRALHLWIGGPQLESTRSTLFQENSQFFLNSTWMKTLSVNVSMSVFSQMMSDNRRCFICSNIAPVSGLEIQVFWKIAHNGWTPYFWTSSVTIEETITVHQGFELKRNWVYPCLINAKGKWYLTTDDASKGRSNHATWEEKKQPNLEFTMWQIGRSFFGRVLTWKFSWLAYGYWGIEVIWSWVPIEHPEIKRLYSLISDQYMFILLSSASFSWYSIHNHIWAVASSLTSHWSLWEATHI